VHVCVLAGNRSLVHCTAVLAWGACVPIQLHIDTKPLTQLQNRRACVCALQLCAMLKQNRKLGCSADSNRRTDSEIDRPTDGRTVGAKSVKEMRNLRYRYTRSPAHLQMQPQKVENSPAHT